MNGLVIRNPWVEKILDGKKTWEIRGRYEMEVFLNPFALSSVTLPEDFQGAFHAKSEVKQSALTIRTVKP